VNFSLPAGVSITWLREIMSAVDEIVSPIENIPPFVGLFVFVEEGLNSFGSLSLRDLVDIRNLEHGSVGETRDQRQLLYRCLVTYGAT
jgi:hypothetical protein